MSNFERPRVTRRETEELRYKPNDMALPAISTGTAFKVITPKNNRQMSELGFAKNLMDKINQKEKERFEYQKSVLSHHVLSTRSASLSSYRASREQEQIESEIISVKETINKFDKEVERFDS